MRRVKRFQNLVMRHRRDVLATLLVITAIAAAAALVYVGLTSVVDSQHSSDTHIIHRLESQNVRLTRLERLQEESARGQCYLQVHAWWIDDKASYQRWHTDVVFANVWRLATSRLEKRLHNTTGKRRSALEQNIGLTHSLVELFVKDGNALQFKPLADCRQALAHPLTYVAPSAVPFASRLFRVRYKNELRHPPRTPAQSQLTQNGL